jgi:hypothetical protein
MTDPNEIGALKASLRGAVSTCEALAALSAKVEALEPRAVIPALDLEELARVTAAHATAASALRGFVETMKRRRETSGSQS